MRCSAGVIVLLAVAGCKGPPARLVAGLADTVVVNNATPVQLPMHVFDAAGHELPDSGRDIRFEWISGARVPVSSRGVVHCTSAGDATPGASGGWRDAELAAAAVATDLLGHDSARPRYAADPSARRARVQLQWRSHHFAPLVLVLRVARGVGCRLPSEKRASERGVERHDCRLARPLPKASSYDALSLRASSEGALISSFTPDPSPFVRGALTLPPRVWPCAAGTARSVARPAAKANDLEKVRHPGEQQSGRHDTGERREQREARCLRTPVANPRGGA